MGAMKKILLVLVVVVIVAILAGVGYVAYLASQLNSPEFQEQVRAEVSRQMGAEVRFEEMDIALRSGVTLRGFAVANPKPFDGDLFAADAFVLRYKLWPLLSGRVEVEQLALEKPVLRLIMDEEGRYNYEALGGKERSTAGETPETPPAPEPATEDGSAGTALDIVLSEVSVSDAVVSMVEEESDTRMLAVEDADFTSAVQIAGGVTQGRASASIGTVSMVDMLFVRDISAPLEMSKEAVKLAPIQAKVAGGRATGAVTAHLKDGFRYEMTLDLDGVDVKTLLQEAKAAAAVAGTLKAKTSVEGTGPLPTMKARGNAEIVDCRIEDSKMFSLLSTVMKVPELASPEFEDCRIEFTLERNVVSTPTVSLKGRALQITGQGQLNLARSTLDYDLELALAEELLAKIGVKELREAFVKRDDGFSVVKFRVFGTTEEPQTDLLQRIGKAAATKAVKDQVNKLFGDKKLF
jgi:autotransporter translocation and assembly factor TamB